MRENHPQLFLFARFSRALSQLTRKANYGVRGAYALAACETALRTSRAITIKAAFAGCKALAVHGVLDPWCWTDLDDALTLRNHDLLAIHVYYCICCGGRPNIIIICSQIGICSGCNRLC